MIGSQFKIVVTFERREDGGIRAYSDDVPGLFLSSSDIEGLIADVPTALSVMLSRTMETEVTVAPLAGWDASRRRPAAPMVTRDPGFKEFLAHAH